MGLLLHDAAQIKLETAGKQSVDWPILLLRSPENFEAKFLSFPEVLHAKVRIISQIEPRACAAIRRRHTENVPFNVSLRTGIL